MPTVAQIAQVIEELAPKELSLPEDPVGIQCGEPDRQVHRIMFALDASESTVDQAIGHETDLLVTHHPLLFRPLGQGMDQCPAGITFVKAVRGNLAVYSAHTNLDASPYGINRFLSSLLRMEETQVLCPTGQGTTGFKVTVFVPVKDLESVRDAAFNAGAGRIGKYSRCSFNVNGEGTFMGDEAANPSVGVTGVFQTVEETRLEITVPDESLRSVLEAVESRHPYEKPVLDIYPLRNNPPVSGVGLHGLLPSVTPIAEIAGKLKESTGAGTIKLVGENGREVRHVAVCAGSGSSLMEEVVATGSELFITGDVKYHDARYADEKGLSVLDVGHFAPERFGMLRFGEILEGRFRQEEWEIAVDYAEEKDPFEPVAWNVPGREKI